MFKTFVMFRNHGAGWVEGTPVRQQPLWDEHAAFTDRLFDTGAILLAGPYADNSGTLLIVKAEDEAAPQAMMRDDPWTIHDIMDVSSVKEWTIFLDSRAQKQP